MRIIDVIQSANAFILAIKGVHGGPDSVRYDRDNHIWTVYYHFSVFHPEIFRDGGVVDGGEFILKVDDKTGKISVFFPFFYPNNKDVVSQCWRDHYDPRSPPNLATTVSVVIMISLKENGECVADAPVCTQGTFFHLWLPICRVLDLKLVPLFETGVTVTEDLADDMMNELKKLEAFALHRHDSHDSQNLIERIQIIMAMLTQYRGNEDVEIWIG